MFLFGFPVLLHDRSFAKVLSLFWFGFWTRFLFFRAGLFPSRIRLCGPRRFFLHVRRGADRALFEISFLLWRRPEQLPAQFPNVILQSNLSSFLRTGAFLL